MTGAADRKRTGVRVPIFDSNIAVIANPRWLTPLMADTPLPTPHFDPTRLREEAHAVDFSDDVSLDRVTREDDDEGKHPPDVSTAGVLHPAR